MPRFTFTMRQIVEIEIEAADQEAAARAVEKFSVDYRDNLDSLPAVLKADVRMGLSAPKEMTNATDH